MEHSIGIGGLVGLIIASSLYVWNSDEFTKEQKTFLLIAMVFAPVQWIGILVIKYYNNHKFESTPERKTEKKLDATISNLTELKEKGILTAEEFETKVQKITSEKTEQQLKNSLEYKQLKSLLDNGILTNKEFESKVQLLKTNRTFSDVASNTNNLSYSDEDLIFDIKKRINECTEQKFKDVTFLRGTIMTLSLRSNCTQILAKYELTYKDDLREELRLKCTDAKISKYILEPLINK